MEEVYKYLEPIFEGIMEKKHISYAKNSALSNFNGWQFVYLLIMNKKVLYIGATSSIQNRLHDHKYSKDFHDVYLIAFKTKEERAFAEKILIREYEPILNKKKYDNSLNCQIWEIENGW
jgi:hypothetical protein